MSHAAFVVPWFGAAAADPASQQIFEIASRLAKRGHRIEVLTTCCRSPRDDWQQNHFPESVSEESGVVVRRFAVGPRDAAAFDSATRELGELNSRPKLLGVSPLSTSAARAFVDENIHSPKLLEYLAGEQMNLVFAGYRNGPTLQGIGAAGKRAFLQPFLRDETAAYLPAVQGIFDKARHLLFASEGEAALAARLFGPAIWRKSTITGEGFDFRAVAGAQASKVPGPYLLHLGQGDTSFLLHAFERYRAEYPGARLQLVVEHPGDPRDGIVALGRLDAAGKASLLSGCLALIAPPDSRTLTEAWLQSKPVVVHGDMLKQVREVEVSGGGFVASSEAEWAQIFATLDSAGDAALRERGERGRSHAQAYGDWEKVLDHYESALDLHRTARIRPVPRRGAVRAIHQLLPSLDYGDAISNQTVFISEVLRDLGYESKIFVYDIGAPMIEFATRFEPGMIGPEDGLVYHHAIGTALTPHAIKHPGPKALVYHNITPGHFFAPWNAKFAEILDWGRKDLHNLAPAFPVSVGDSTYNADELREAGFRDPSVMPIFVDPMRWGKPADPEWMKMLQDGRTNILFVGRIAPNKRQEHLIAGFKEYLSYDPQARLILVGVWPEGDPYARFLRDEALRHGISEQVFMTSKVTDAQLLACYRTAHLFWSMSEHEGFCVPLIEAMWFDVPVLAYRSTAIPETLGAGGIMFSEKRFPELAALAHLLVTDPALRRTVLAAQRARRPAFLPEAILPVLMGLVARLGADVLKAQPASAQRERLETTSE